MPYNLYCFIKAVKCPINFLSFVRLFSCSKFGTVHPSKVGSIFNTAHNLQFGNVQIGKDGIVKKILYFQSLAIVVFSTSPDIWGRGRRRTTSWAASRLFLRKAVRSNCKLYYCLLLVRLNIFWLEAVIQRLCRYYTAKDPCRIWPPCLCHKLESVLSSDLPTKDWQ